MGVDRVKVLLAETRLSASEAAKLAGVGPQVLRRWCKVGGRGGVKLEHIWLGGRLMTTVEAIHRFLAASSESA